MAKRSIVRLGEDDILRKHCRAVERFDGRLAALLDDMAETIMRYYKHDSINQMFSQLPEHVIEAGLELAGLEL